MSCPNSDPNFDKVLSNFYDIKSLDYPSNRKYTFYFVCIIVRFLLYYFVYVNIDKPYIVEIITFLAFASLFNLYPKINEPNQRQWWSRQFQFAIALLISVVGILVIFKLLNVERKMINGSGIKLINRKEIV